MRMRYVYLKIFVRVPLCVRMLCVCVQRSADRCLESFMSMACSTLVLLWCLCVFASPICANMLVSTPLMSVRRVGVCGADEPGSEVI